MEASRATLKLTRGGSSATLENDPIVIPRPAVSGEGSDAVITTTGDGRRRIAARNRDSSADLGITPTAVAERRSWGKRTDPWSITADRQNRLPVASQRRPLVERSPSRGRASWSRVEDEIHGYHRFGWTTAVRLRSPCSRVVTCVRSSEPARRDASTSVGGLDTIRIRGRPMSAPHTQDRVRGRANRLRTDRDKRNGCTRIGIRSQPTPYSPAKTSRIRRKNDFSGFSSSGFGWK